MKYYKSDDPTIPGKRDWLKQNFPNCVETAPTYETYRKRSTLYFETKEYSSLMKSVTIKNIWSNCSSIGNDHDVIKAFYAVPYIYITDRNIMITSRNRILIAKVRAEIFEDLFQIEDYETFIKINGFNLKFLKTINKFVIKHADVLVDNSKIHIRSNIPKSLSKLIVLR